MFDKMINDKIFCGIDIGARTIKAGLLRIKDETDLELIGVFENKTHGFKDNAVSDLDEFSECIHRTVAELTNKTGIKVKTVQLGLGGALIEARETNTVIPLVDKGSKIITHRDIKKVNENARLLGVQMEEESLHDLPQYYRIDDLNSTANPLGLYGRKLGVHSLMIVINENRIRNITRAVHQAGYDVAHVYFNSYAASDIVLSDDSKKEGCVLIDIGSQHTSVLVFKGGVLQHLKGVNIGGNNFTNSIADHLSLPFDLAEEIKKSYAVAIDDQHGNEEILIKKEEGYHPIKRGDVYGAIRPEIHELIGFIRSIVLNSGLRDQIPGGIMVIGGGALLPGFIEKIGEEIELPVRLGKVVNLTLHKKLNHTATFSSVVGLALGGYKRTLRFALSSSTRQHWTKSIRSRMKELYQEYF